MELSWRKVMGEKERVEKNVIMEGGERDFFFFGFRDIYIYIECIK